MGAMTSPALVWFRQDLRLADNPALAALDGRPALLVYVLDDEAAGAWAHGGAQRWWLHHSLASLTADLTARGASLHLARGPATRIIPQLAAAIGASEVIAGRLYEPWARSRDAAIAEALQAEGRKLSLHTSSLLHEPHRIRTGTGKPYSVYTPFSRALFALGEPPPPLPTPARIETLAHPGLPLEALELLPKRDWAREFPQHWQPGEAGAAARIKAFSLLNRYDATRNLPGIPGTSGLSPHLRFGEISPRQLWRSGWMHNRVRMITASFLVKHLLQPWQAGEAWFWDTLLDGDLASNAASWQWVAGCGADAAPYFRVFAPVLQGEKFDADGAYVRRWVPEIAGLPDKFLHKPWEAPEIILRGANIRLGVDYPRPVMDHGQGRARALAAYAEMRGAAA